MNKKIKELDKTLTERVHALEREQSYYRSLALVIVLLVTAIVGTWIKDGVLQRLFDGPAIVQSNAGTAIAPILPMPGPSITTPVAVPLAALQSPKGQVTSGGPAAIDGPR